jgi:hypothetical protein
MRIIYLCLGSAAWIRFQAQPEVRAVFVWFKKQYDDIKGNMKWALLAVLWAPLIALAKKLLGMIPNIPSLAIWPILFVLSAIAFVWLAKHATRTAPVQPTQSENRPTLIPTLSALQGKTPDITFDPTEWFRVSYFSPLTAEIEANMKVVAARFYPQDREGFWARFTGVGITAYMHDITWAYIFRSQLLMLAELNSKNGIMPIGDARKHYAKAASENQGMYANYSFEQWLSYLKSDMLVIQHPSDMLEITHKGRDLLKYLAHWGRSSDFRKG